MNLDIEKKWLVKSDSKIMGPYSVDQLEELLLKRQVALIDEVRDMEQRWLYIREVPQLKQLVETVRYELSLRTENTQTVQINESSETNTLAKTQTKTSELQNIEFTSAKPAFTDVSVEAEDIAFSDIDMKFPEMQQSTEKKKFLPQFVSTLDPNAKAEVQSFKKQYILSGLAVVVLSLVAFLGMYFYKKNEQIKSEQSQITNLRKLVIYGADQKASEAYQKLPETLQSKVLSDIIILFPKLDQDGAINLDEAIQSLQTKKITANQKSLIELIQFNKKLSLNNLNEAKIHLVKAKDFDPSSEFVTESEAIFNYLDNKNADSAKIFLNLFSTSNKGRHLYGLALNHLVKSTISDTDMIEKIERYLATRVEYKKELCFIQFYLALKNNNLQAASGFITDFVNTPVQLSSQFKLPSVIYGSFYKIEKIMPFYEKVKSQLSSKNIGLIELYLSLEKNDAYSAQKILELIQGQLTAPEKHSAQIIIYSLLNRFQEALAVEKTSANESLSIASQFVILKLKKENNIADMNNQVDLLKKEKNILTLWADLQLIKSNEPDKMRSFIQLNLIQAEDFVPFINARAQFE